MEPMSPFVTEIGILQIRTNLAEAISIVGVIGEGRKSALNVSFFLW